MKMEFKIDKGLLKHLADAQKLTEVKQIVRKNVKALNRNAVSNAVYTKGYSTGATRRSITPIIENGGLSGKSTMGENYDPYLENGTRFMDAQPAMKPAFNQQKEQFKRDMEKIGR